MTLEKLAARVRRLEDERDLLHRLHTYGHALDYGFEDEFLDCFTADAVLEMPDRQQIVGADAIGDHFRRHTHAPAFFHKHFVVDPSITLDGDRATVDSLFARLDAYEDGPAILCYGRYRDTLVRCPDGRWRFSERTAEVEALRGFPPAIREHYEQIDGTAAASVEERR